MYCFNCGREIDQDVRYCPHCGTQLDGNNSYTQNQQSPTYTYSDDKRSLLWCFLSFMFPFVGIIAYFVFKREKPIKAKWCLNVALVSILINIITLIF